MKNKVRNKVNSSYLIRKIISFCLIFLATFALSGWTSEATSFKIPIFGFHDIIDSENISEIPPERKPLPSDYNKEKLTPFLEALFKDNYWFLDTEDLFTYFIQRSKPVPAKHLNQKPVMITFDDGYAGVHKNVFPLMQELEKKYSKKGKIVLFINPGFLGVNNGLDHVSCEDIRTGYEAGIYDIQSHGENHKDLTKITGKDLKFELAQAKWELHQCLHDLNPKLEVSDHIAYPYGSVNRQIAKSLPTYYLTGYLYDNQILRINRLKNQYFISRFAVNQKSDPANLVKLANRATKITRLK
jgi:peptidoglycan/xylan/chitin deacetylase (PgdA/CDA1 family)